MTADFFLSDIQDKYILLKNSCVVVYVLLYPLPNSSRISRLSLWRSTCMSCEQVTKCPLVAKLCNANTHNMVVSPVSSLIFTCLINQLS